MPTIGDHLYGPRCNPAVHDLAPTCDACAPVLVGGWPLDEDVLADVREGYGDHPVTFDLGHRNNLKDLFDEAGVYPDFDPDDPDSDDLALICADAAAGHP